MVREINIFSSLIEWNFKFLTEIGCCSVCLFFGEILVWEKKENDWDIMMMSYSMFV